VTVALKPFQEAIVDALVAVVDEAATRAERVPQQRALIAADLGLVVVGAPTGSGKTLMTATALERLTGRHAFVWFWFAPFATLIDQTRLTLAERHRTLRPRLLVADRAPEATAPGDVFLSTWSAVAVAARDARQARSSTDTMPSADELIADLKARGFLIGCVVDEAHWGFHGATEAGRFYREVLRPDATLLVTATPDQRSMADMRRILGHATQGTMLTVAREDVVRARLNKGALRAVTFVVPHAVERLVDLGEVALFAGVRRHVQVREDLASAGVPLTPLLLVQVDGDAGVKSARDLLVRHGIADERIAVHTAREPDPDLIAVAQGNDVEALIFKVAVALGFDAPRAFTLVSMRPTRDPDFGTQIIGRLMRVHRLLQGRSLTERGAVGDALRRLDEASVFLAASDMQAGLATAADRIQALRSEIQVHASRLVVSEIDSFSGEVRTLDRHGQIELLPSTVQEQAGEPDDAPGAWQGTLPLSGAIASTHSPASQALDRVWANVANRAQAVSAQVFTHARRRDLDAPERLLVERLPPDADDLIDCIAARVAFDPVHLAAIHREQAQVTERMRQLFGTDAATTTIFAPISPAKIASQARQTMMFCEALDAGELARRMQQRLDAVLRSEVGAVLPPQQLRRALEKVLAAAPDLVRNAWKQCLARDVRAVDAATLPDRIDADEPLDPSTKNIYGVYPASMNSWERRFAELLDDDNTGTVLWWHRNDALKPHSAALLIETGERYFPDFVVGVRGRRSRDGVILVEVKNDFASFASIMKNRATHSAYGAVPMVFLNPGTNQFQLVRQQNGANFPSDVFDVGILPGY
jgi:hypothetical protein